MSSPSAVGSAPALRAGKPIDPEAFEEIRRRAILECCKWDPQVGDVGTLAPFPLILRGDEWSRLAGWAERMSAEALEAERELLEDADDLGLPRALRRVFRRGGDPTPAAGRVVRYDFHPTRGGWAVSEANTDVPGGFTESSAFTAMVAARFPHLRPAGDPAAAWADVLARAGREATLLSAPGYMEDFQVVSYLASMLRARGCEARLAGPRDFDWRADVVVRFYQAEWLTGMPRRTEWPRFFFGGRTPVANPGTAVLIESKRFPLAWGRLRASLPTWRALVPETRDPREAPWREDDGWILKTAFCNTGDTVSARSLLPADKWRAVEREVARRPEEWVAQRRFEPLAVDTPTGPLYPCLGVYTVDGRAAGLYGRVSPRPVIDFEAVDIAVLVGDGDE
jgi:hypothetical protein